MSLRGRRDNVASRLGTMQVLVVACGRTYLAIPGAIVRGVVEFGDAVEARIVSLFGETCRVTDLAARLGLPPAVLTPDMRIILCGEHRARQAWRVDRTLGIEDIELQAIKPLPPHFVGVEQSWFTGMFLFRDTVALTLNAGWLMSQSMDAFVAQTITESAMLEEQHVLAEAPADTGEEATPAAAGHQRRHKLLETPAGEAASLDVLESLVLEESTDVEDNQAPWADA
jgi:CheW-like domain